MTVPGQGMRYGHALDVDGTSGQSWDRPWASVEPYPGPDSPGPRRLHRVAPSHWGEWRRDAPPRWEGHYGRAWHEENHERDWRRTRG